MDSVFLKIINMSITASWLILAVMLIRKILKKAPKWIACVLWVLVAIRLVLPISFQSELSVVPSSETIPSDIALSDAPAINSGIYYVNSMVNPMLEESFAPNVSSSANPMQLIVSIASTLWLVGMAALLIYALYSYIRLRKTVRASIPLSGNIMACDDVKTPFILGIFKPRIYVPTSVSGRTLEHVIAHETAHIKRRDHWWKPLGYIILTVYWFNPLCWVAYYMLCRDIEMACDEKVVRGLERDDVADYSQALLDCSNTRRFISACPVAFGEVGVKQRIKRALSYKKPAFWIIIIGAVACAVLAVFLMTDPHTSTKLDEKLAISMDMAIAGHYKPGTDGGFVAGAYDVLDVEKDSGRTTVYAWVRFSEYTFDGNIIKEEWGLQNPAAITFDTSKEGDYSSYDKIEFWEPHESRNYEEHVKSKFPASTWKRVLYNEKAEEMEEKCLKAAQDYFSEKLNADTLKLTAIVELYEDGKLAVNPVSMINGVTIPSNETIFVSTDNVFLMPNINDVVKIEYRDGIITYMKPEINDVVSMEVLMSGEPNNMGIDELRAKHPEFFGLPTEKGLEVYVWQMAPASYTFALMPVTENEKTFDELIKMGLNGGVSASEMRLILSAYDVPESKVFIIPYQNPISSYVGEHDDSYVDNIRKMLFTEHGVKTRMAFAGWTDNTSVFSGAVNAQKVIKSGGEHLPVYRFENAEELKAFRTEYYTVLTMDRGWDEVPSFDEVAAEYDDSFFSDNDLLLIYVPFAQSCTYRFYLRAFSVEDSSLCMYVAAANNPESFDEMAAGWFIFVEVSREDMKNCKSFDAIFESPQ